MFRPPYPRSHRAQPSAGAFRYLSGALTCGALALSSSASLALTLPAVISDHAMIQANKPVAVWGWANPGEEVTLQWTPAQGGGGSNSLIVTTAANGRWSGSLPAVADGVGGDLSVRTKSEGPLQVKDVLAGEVWLCSGQSNMSYLLTSRGRNANESTSPEITEEAQRDATAAKGALRYFAVKGKFTDDALDDVQGKWIVATPETVGACFSLSWNFAVALHHKLNVPVGVINSAIGGTAIEPWTPGPELKACSVGPAALEKYKDRLAKTPADVKAKFDADLAAWKQRFPTEAEQHKNLASKPVFVEGNPNMPSRLYNGMIHGLEPYTLKGFLWFQGDGNFFDPELYGELFKNLITSWRHHFHDDNLPFYYVEMQNYRKPQEKPVEANPMSLIREAQQAALALPNVDVAASLDQGIDKPNYEAHFPNKKPLGERMAGLALSHLYEHPGLVNSPAYKSYTQEGSKVRLHLEHAEGLRLRGTAGLTGFALRSANGDWVWAKGEIQGEDIVLWSEEVPQPAAIRYAWAFNPLLSVENKAGLPLRPFRTDPEYNK